MKRHLGLAVVFGIVGLIFTGAITGTAILVSAFSGMGDGASRCIYINPYSYVPLSFYFGMGIIGSLTKSTKIRAAAATVAHSIPLLVTGLLPLTGLGFVFAMVIVTYSLFAYPWYKLFKEM